MNVHLSMCFYGPGSTGKMAIVEGAMVFKSEDEDMIAYAFPAGTDEHVKRALDKMKHIVRSEVIRSVCIM